MPEYLSPGVYVEEIDAGPKPIEGVSTSTVGAVGVTRRGPTRGRHGPFTGKPELVTSFSEFVKKFGGYVSVPSDSEVNRWALNATEGGRWWQFPLAVKGFFDNGGQRLYVKRVYSSTASPASAVLGQGIVSEITQDASSTETTLKVRHLIGAQVGGNVTIFANGFAIGVFQITAYNGTESVTLNIPVGQELKSGRDFIAIIPRQAVAAADPDPHLTVSAKSEGDWGGNEISDDGIRAGNGLSVRVSPVVGATLKIMADATTGGSVARTTVTAPAAANTTTIEVASMAGFVNGDRVLIDNREYVLNNVLDPTTTVATAANAGDITIAVASVAGLADGNTVNIAGHSYTLSNVTAAAAGGTDTFDIASAVPAGLGWPIGTEVRVLPRTFDINPGVPAGRTWPAGTTVRRMRAANTPAAAGAAAGSAVTINVWNAAQLYRGALVELDNGTLKEVRTVDSVAGNAVTLSANLSQAYFEDHRMRVIEAEVGVRYRHNQTIEAEETFTGLRLVDDGSMNYLVTHVNEQSALINLVAGDGFSVDTLQEFPSVAPAVAPNGERFWMDLTEGRDNLDGLTVDDFVGEDGGSTNRTGIQAFEDIDEISLCLAPGMWSSTVHSALIQHCEILRDRFAILDPQDNLNIEDIRGFREPLDTKYAALYYPWIEVRDPSVKRNVVMAPSGHMAGIYARVDVERGVHKAPANEVIRGISKIAADVCKREQDMLNPRGINALRFFPGRGNRVWGARTLSSDASWKYINVRRLFIFVEESIDEGTQWVVFEPNDEPLWARVRQTIENFLTTVWRSGALEGAKPNEAFFVKCDRTTMTQDDIDNGRLICHIGIAPVKPAEFVIFRIQQKTRDNLNS